MDNVRPRASYLPIKRSYYTRPTIRPKDLKQEVKTFGVKNMIAARTRAVVNTGKGKMDNALKKAIQRSVYRIMQWWIVITIGGYVGAKEGDPKECKKQLKLLDESSVILRAPRQYGVLHFGLIRTLFLLEKGIKREFSVARTPQQNGVAERKNRTLIEAARTMLADSLLPIPFWAEAVNTACYVLNRVLVTKPQNKTPYELLIGKFDGKSDEGYLLGYSTTSKAFRVYNKRTKRVEENMHIDFLEDQPNVAGSGPNWMFDLDFLTNIMNYIPVHQKKIRILVEDVVQAAQEKPSKNSPKDNDTHDSEDVAEKEEQHMLTEADQALQDDLERMIAQEIAAKTMDDATRQAFEEEKKRAAQATSINKLNTSRPSVGAFNSPLVSTANTPYASAASTPTGANIGGSSFVYLGGQIPIDASTLPNANLPI
ncbi:ribonuclease H-like domain-containing protein, partial [Tanacetum coccineum]